METGDSVYRALQRYLDRLPAGFPEVGSGLDIKLLRRLFTPEEAALAIQLSAKPEPLRRIYRRVRKDGVPLEEVQAILERMSRKGTILVSEEGYSEKHYSNASFSVGGIYNYQVDRLTKELIDEYWQYQAEARSKVTAKVTAKPALRGMAPLRTVPVERSIPLPERQQIAIYDDVKRLMVQVRGRIAVANCICRQSADILGSPCTKTHLRETCLIIGPDHAKRHVDMGIGRYITRDEAFVILEKAQTAGLVLQPENSRRPEAICCCCGDCCVLLRRFLKAPRPADFFTTNYYVEVVPEACNGCGACTETCQLGARVMVDQVSVVDPDRCIGCGNCVTVCPTEANRLRRKTGELSLPATKDDYYMKILSRRVGRRKVFLMKTRMFLGLKA